MKRTLSLLLALLLTVSLAACGAPEPTGDLMKDVTPRTVTPVELSDVSTAAVTDFAVRLFRAAHTAGENTLISPLSVMVALSMTANGAAGDTLAQMEAVLGMPIADLGGWIHSYMRALPETEKYKLSLANSIWMRENLSFAVEPDFLQVNADYYGADILRAPFDEETCREINRWVEDNTDGMIRNILDRIPADAVMYLINALAFDAEWQKIYEENQIRAGQFTTEDGTVREVEMMYAEEGRYLENAQATGFIKYYADRKYAFAALLPRAGVSVADCVAALDGAGLHAMLTGAEATPVSTAIPKFESGSKVEMSELLAAMGMADLFSPQKANLTRIGSPADGNLYASRVLHQTYINVDGKGTKAGAATVVEVSTESCPPIPEHEVFLDRPFVYMLIDCENNLPFFIGTMMDTAG